MRSPPTAPADLSVPVPAEVSVQYISVTNLELVLLGVGVWVCLAAIERYFYRSDIPNIMGDIEFRDVARAKQALSEEECLDILYVSFSLKSSQLSRERG